MIETISDGKSRKRDPGDGQQQKGFTAEFGKENQGWESGEK